MQALKRWMPFIVIIIVLLITTAFLFLNRQEVYYRPQTASPAVIYREACQYCHGDKGQGTGLLYPGFDDEDLTMEKIRHSIQNGALLMPAYVNITGDTLQALVKYIYHKEYLNTYPVLPDSAAENP
jgi:mono/diheme cytochrome c family protein